MTTPWMHPLTRATRILTVRLLELEKKLPDNAEDREGWAEYVRTAEVLTRIITATQGGGSWGDTGANAAANAALRPAPPRRPLPPRAS